MPAPYVDQVAVRPVPVLQARRCADDRYPALAGEWVVGCVGDDRVNVAVSLVTGRVVTLTAPVLSPSLGDGWLWATGRPAGGWVLPVAARGGFDGAEAVMVPHDGVAPATVTYDGGTRRAAVPYETHVDLIDLSRHVWPRWDARPLPGESVAVGVGWVAWSERGLGGEAERDVWLVRTEVAQGDVAPMRAPAVVGGGRGDQHGVGGGGSSLWWVDGDEVVKLDVHTGAERRFLAFTGFEAGLALAEDGSLSCWEDRRAFGTPAGIDIHCSDGTVVDRPGDQRWPSLGAGWLIWREGEQVLATAAPGHVTVSSPSPESP
ncbi:MAG: hypothetical protein EXR69_03850 [Myxococcales bacterium]|nr:hypothetical protein [Myxococcales bacterium]